MGKKCKNCGLPAEDGDYFCTECRCDYENMKFIVENEKSQKRKLIINVPPKGKK